MLLSDFYMHFLIRHLSSFRNPPEALKNELVNKSHKTKRVEIHKKDDKMSPLHILLASIFTRRPVYNHSQNI